MNEKKMADYIAEEVFSYLKHMPGYDEDSFPTYGIILTLVQQGIERAADTEELCAGIERAKNLAYLERNLLVAFLSKLFPSHLAKHPESDTEWDDDWCTIVFIDAPTGQLSWHIHDSEIGLFDHLEWEENNWDGHTTEEKYERIREIKPELSGGKTQ